MRRIVATAITAAVLGAGAGQAAPAHKPQLCKKQYPRMKYLAHPRMK
jgi:hypothetical protein